MPPIFSYFLTKKAFFSLYIAGIIGYSLNIYAVLINENIKLATPEILFLIIIIFLGLYAFFIIKKMYNDFVDIFSVDSNSSKINMQKTHLVENLFVKKEMFENYRVKVIGWLNSKNEKIFSFGFASILFTLFFIQDIFDGRLISSILDPLLLSRYLFTFVWSLVLGVLLFSIFWFVIVMIRALYEVKREMPQLHITQFIVNLEKDTDLQKKNLDNNKIGLLNLSFRRFQAGLTVIVGLILSSSLQIALFGLIYSIPYLAYFLITGEIQIVSYSFCTVFVLISFVVFVFGQYGAWRLWNNSKENGIHLLHQICTFRTQQFLNNNLNEDTTILRNIINDLESLKTVTYSSSSFYKVVSVNFLTFGPLILKQILTFYLG